MNGIYTLANDVVFDQLVALLNSIEANIGNVPIRVIAYDDNLDQVRSEIKKRENVELIEDHDLFAPWDKFSEQVWNTHPYAMKTWQEKGIKGVYRLACNHRYFGFDVLAPFDKFIYFDADVIVLNSLDSIFKALDNNDVVVYDFQYKDPSHIYNVKSDKLFQVFPESRIKREIFCSGCFASKKGLLPPKTRDFVIEKLQSGESEILYLEAPNQSVLNYTIMSLGLKVYNFALNLPEDQKTGCSVTSSHFESKNNLLYDKGTRLTYLHYIGLSYKLFTRLCQGENFDFPYRDLFLHYRYLHEPEKRPQFQGKPKPYNPPPSLTKKILKKLRLVNN